MKPSDLKPDWSRESTSTGYVVVYCPDHPRAWSTGYVYKHRLLMELHLDRFLARTEHVHHKDEDRHNNALSNLKVETPSEHARHHATGRELIELTCEGCGGGFGRVHRQMHKNNKRVFCSRDCYYSALRG